MPLGRYLAFMIAVQSLSNSSIPISFQLCKSLLACKGIPGKALKLEDAQKKVLSHCSTNMQLGSGWNPGSMGLKYVELRDWGSIATAKHASVARRHTSSVLIIGVIM